MQISLIGVVVPEKRILVDKFSGKDFQRPQYRKFLGELDSQSVLYVKFIDRLGRNYQDLGEQWRIITREKGADIATEVMEHPKKGVLLFIYSDTK